MTPDESYATLLLALLIVVVTQKQFSSVILEIMLKVTRPGATVLLLALLLFIYHKGLHYTFLVLALISVFLLKDMWTYWVKSDNRRLYLEVGRDNDRFDHSTSIDLLMADGNVKHAPPSMYSPGWSPKLLVFPPSAATQKEMNG